MILRPWLPSDVDERFREDQERILAPLLTPDNYRPIDVKGYVRVVGSMGCAIVAFMYGFQYLAFGNRYFPWWGFLFAGALVSTFIFLDDDGWNASFEIEVLRHGEHELYGDIDRLISAKLENTDDKF